MDNVTKQTDEELVRLYVEGDNNAFDILLKRYESKVFTYIAYSVRNQEIAEDLFQDVFVKVLTRLHQGGYVENGKFSSWIMRIAHNLLIDYHRKDVSGVLLSSDTSDYDVLNDTSLVLDDNAENEIINSQTLGDLKQLIHLLPDNQREVVLMRFYQDLSFKEIAEITDVSINTALGRMRYALINLRKLAEEHDISFAS